MIVFVHSLGSLWQHKDHPGGTRVWNTTGVREGDLVRSYATTFGQLQFGPKVRPFLHHERGVAGASWTTSEMYEVGPTRKIHLFCRAARHANPDWFLVVLTEALVGQIEAGGVDPINAVVLSRSQKKERQEWMLLVRRFAWVSGAVGSAVWTLNGRTGNWSVTKW